MIYVQNYSPLPWPLLSLFVAALPVLVLFYLLVVRRASPPYAAAGGAAAALLIATLVYHMPAPMAGMAFLNGALFGLLPICWVIFNAMFLYNTTVVTGRFEGIKNSVAGLSADHRLQAVLIAFAFGAFLEGAAGGGTPVAICAAMLVGLGFRPFQAACLCLIANTSPVAYGGFGTPIIVLHDATGIDTQLLSNMAGNQLPILSCIVPIWLVRCMCSWKETFEVLPAIGVAGGSFALCQYLFAHSPAFPLTDLAGGLISLVVTAIFLRFWKPKRIWRVDNGVPEDPVIHPAAQPTSDCADQVETLLAPWPEGKPEIVSETTRTTDMAAVSGYTPTARMPLGQALHAWMPFLILCVLMVCVGINKKSIDNWNWGPFRTLYKLSIPLLDKQVERRPPVVEKNTREPAVFNFNWLTTPGTSVFLTVLIILPLLRVTREQFHLITKRTVHQMAVPVPTIVFMLGLGYVTRFSGLDATLGMAFKNTGALYPFFAALLGWLGVFLTGTDAGSNALFGSLQKITAGQLGLNPVLICAANSTGGVMGKMIDAQSICVATAATERVGTEADIFKYVIWHSMALAALVGLLTLLQAYVFPFTQMVPH